MGDGLILFESPPHPDDFYMKRDFSGPAPDPTTRTLRPIKYYFIDFDLSHKYRAEDAPYDPKKRPTMSEVVSRFDVIMKNLSWLKLRSPVVRVDARWTRQDSIKHWKTQNKFQGER
ncbi:hypothetical protein C0993_012737 [Termitomyces sp. T159_Od127]|nr:hypothetical protein C0993_012737 [Termitomyces sp. T159_Od127]